MLLLLLKELLQLNDMATFTQCFKTRLRNLKKSWLPDIYLRLYFSCLSLSSHTDNRFLGTIWKWCLSIAICLQLAWKVPYLSLPERDNFCKVAVIDLITAVWTKVQMSKSHTYNNLPFFWRLLLIPVTKIYIFLPIFN